nr:probable serine/threonine-protein kinase At1g01540 isoform X2 [Ipomoea batatas]
MSGFLNDELSKRTTVFGLRLWVVVGVCVGAAIVLVLFLISLWLSSKKIMAFLPHKKPKIPNVSKEIQEIRVDPSQSPKLLRAAMHDPVPEPEEESRSSGGDQRSHGENGKGHRILHPERVGPGSGSSHGSEKPKSGDQAIALVPEVSHLGWGHWYTLRELEISTNGFADENVIGEGGYGIVYHGVLEDNTKVAVKNLLNNRGQAEREFKVEVEAIGRVRHKNLVRLLGYCAEGAHRSYITTRVMGTFGYVAPEYASTGMLNERSDVYSFGILLMEIITGRNPVDYSRPPGEVNLVDWLKTMVSNRNAEGVVDPKLPEKPSSRALKRILLVALRCVDPNAQKRPKMGHVLHMLEADEFPFRDDRRAGRDHPRSHREDAEGAIKKPVTES